MLETEKGLQKAVQVTMGGMRRGVRGLAAAIRENNIPDTHMWANWLRAQVDSVDSLVTTIEEKGFKPHPHGNAP